MAKSYSSIKAGWTNSNLDKATGTQKKKSYKDIKASEYDFGVNEDYIKSFEQNASSFFSNVESDYNNNGYANSKSNSENYQAKRDTLYEQAGYIKAYLNANKNNIDSKSYEDLMSYVDNINTASRQYNNAFQDANKFYSQFDSEESYNKYVEERKKIDAIKNQPDFQEYSDKGASIENPTYSEAEGKAVIFGNRIGAKEVGNIVTYSRENAPYIALDSDPVGNAKYNLMSNEEVSIYNYYLAKENEGQLEKGTAQKYLNELEDTLNQRQAGNAFERISDIDSEFGKSALEYAFGAYAGLDQFSSGIKNLPQVLGIKNDDYVPISSTQYLSGMVRNDLADNGAKILGSSLGQIAYDTITTTSNMLPTIAASYIAGAFLPALGVSAMGAAKAGEIAGTALLGASATGNTYAELLDSGMNKGQARAVSIVKGVWEGASEYYLGAIEGLAGGKITKALDKTALYKGVKLAGNGMAYALLDFFTDAAVEGMEEVIQDIGESVIDGVMTGKWEFSSVQDQAYNFVLGALSAAVMNGVGKTSEGITNYRQAKQIKAEGKVNELKNVGNTFDAQTVAYQLAEKVDDNTGAYKLSRLLHEINANLSEQTVSDLKNELMKNGVAEKDAGSIAEWLSVAVDGGNFSKAQQKALDENPVISRVMKKVIFDRNSTVNQRLQGIMNYEGVEGQSGVDYAAIAKAQSNEGLSKSINNRYSIENAYNNEVRRAYDSFTKPVDPKIEQMVSDAVKTMKGMNDSTATSTIDSVEKSVENKVSDTGKASLVSTGEEVSIKKIKSISNGNMELELSDGRTVNSKDINYSSKNEALVYESVVAMGYSVDTANAIVNGMNSLGDVSANKYLLGINEGINYGKTGYPLEKIQSKGFFADLTETQKKFAYDLGRSEARTMAESEQTKINQSKGKNTKKGKVHLEASTSNMTERQKASVSAIGRVVSDITHNDVYIFESVENDGKRVFAKDIAGHKAGESAPNGFYDPNTGAIFIDLYAGNNGEGVILWTAGHELSHFIRQWSPAKFKVLADFLMEEYGKKGVDIQTLIQAQINKAENAGRTLSFDAAYEEVVADAMQTMFTDTNLSEKLAKLQAKNKSIVEKIKDFFTDLYNRLKEAYKGLSPQSQEAQFVREMTDSIEKLSDLFAEAIEDAGESFSKYSTEEELANTKYLELAENPTENASKLREMVDDAAERAGFTVKSAYHGSKNHFGQTVFDANGRKVVGFFFTDSLDVAESYSGAKGANSLNDNTKKGNYEVYLKTENPFVFDAKGAKFNRLKVNEEIKTWIKDNLGELDYSDVSDTTFTDSVVEYAKAHGYDSVIFNNVIDTGWFAQSEEQRNQTSTVTAVFNSDQIKSADLVTYDDNGDVIPLSERFNTENEDIRYSGRETDEFFAGTNLSTELKSALTEDGVTVKDGAVTKFSERTWSATDKAKLLNDLVKAGYSKKKAQKWINDVNSVAKYIVTEKNILDYISADNQTAMKSDEEYYYTIDFSTLCAKRLLYQGTYDAIQHRLPNYAIMPGDTILIRRIMDELGHEVPCAFCYVESRRKLLGKFAERWMKEVGRPKYGIKNENVTTTDGLEELRTSNPEAYEDFTSWMRQRGSANPKVVELRTEYKEDAGILKLSSQQIEMLKKIGGLRIQSFSDFEIPHTIDMMQVVLDMARMNLPSQAYTKVPAFAYIFGDTGIKINLSVVANVDENGNLVFDDKEGMDHKEALKLREMYDKTCGTILVGKNEAQIRAAMKDARIDFIIPFHRSGWGKAEFRVLGLSGYQDFQNIQGEFNVDYSPLTKARKKAGGFLFPEDYWDYDATGDQNTVNYLKKCQELNRIPRFLCFAFNENVAKAFVEDYNSTHSTKITEDDILTSVGMARLCSNNKHNQAKNLRQIAFDYLNYGLEHGADVQPGYWKTLVDYRMYDSKGKSAPQQAVKADFNMEYAQKFMSEYDGNPNELPVDQEAVDKFVDLVENKENGKYLRKLKDAERRHEAELKGEKFSDRVLMGSLFSGGGMLEAGLVYQMLDKQFAVEYDSGIAAVYRDNWGDHIYAGKEKGDVNKFDISKFKDIFYLHASPVCHNYSSAKHNAEETALDRTSAESTARHLETAMPQVFTVENAPAYRKSNALKIITDKLTELGYKWDVDVYNSADYGASTSRNRTILRAVRDGELPAKPQKQARTNSWDKVTKDLWDGLEETNIPNFMMSALKNTTSLPIFGEDGKLNINKPLLIITTNSGHTVSYAWEGELCPTLTTVCREGRLLMPDGKVYKTTPRFMARIQGLPDDYKLPKATTRAYTIIGNGIPTQLTKAVMGGVLDSAYEQTYGEMLYSEREQENPVLKTLNGNKIQRSKYGVGKQMGNQIYVHKNYADEIVPADVWEKAQSLVPNDFSYNCIMYDTKNPDVVRFDEAPDFDWAREPKPGKMLKVDTATGDVSPAKGNGNMIWHHKWQWVRNDYEGFDVQESYNWSKQWLEKITNPSGSLRVWNQLLIDNGLPTDSTDNTYYSLREVEPVQPSTKEWTPGVSTVEAMKIYPNLWNVSADESETRNPTQIAGTVSTYRKIYEILKAEGFNGTILDASSGLGFGTKAGIEEYGFNVDDIEPYPGKNYQPKYMDYSALDNKYDVIISNAVLNVLPQDQRDALVVKMGELLNDGGKMFINVRSLSEIQALQKAIDKKTGQLKNIKISDSEVAETTKGSYQKGFKKSELKAYLEDALGSQYTVTPTTKFGGTSVIVTKNALKYSERDTDATDNRTLLSNALATTAKNEIEKKYIAQYQEKIDTINAEQKKLTELRAKIKELSFAKGARDAEQIRKLQSEATKTANRINTFDKQLLKLEATKPLQAVLDREKLNAKKKAEKAYFESLNAYKEKAAKTQRELMERYDSRIKRGIESRSKTELRHKIQNKVKELNNLLLKGDKDHHVPLALQKATADALSVINMDTVNAEERLAKLEERIKKSSNPDEIARLQKTYDNIELQGENMKAKLDALSRAYDEIKNSTDPLIANAYDDGIKQMITNIIDEVGDTPLRNMTLSQLEQVYDMYKAVLHTIRTANKTFKAERQETIEELGKQVMNQVILTGGNNKYAIKNLEFLKKFMWNNMKPVYAMKAIGSETLSNLFNNVRAGEDTWAVDVSEAKEYFNDKAKEYGYKDWDFEKRYDFTSTSGKTFSLNLQEIMSLYAYSKRDQAELHLRMGGIVFENSDVTKKVKGIPVTYTVNTADAYNISEQTLMQIIGTLSEEQGKFVDEMQRYLAEDMGAKGNEITRAMYDINLFKDKNYFPLRSASQYMFSQNEAAGEVKLKNSGFTKSVVPKANNPIILQGFMDVWSEHVSDMAMYHSFVLPLEDFNRVYNFKTPTSEKEATGSVKMTIQNAYGKAANDYIKQMLTDLNGGARSSTGADIGNKLTSLFKKGAVFASASVVIQQPSAIARAWSMVDQKYFNRTLKKAFNVKEHNAQWAEVKKYAPVAIIKEMGYFDTNMGKSTTDWMTSMEYEGFKEKAKALVTDENYRDEMLSKAPALADELAWVHIWEAVKEEIADTNPNIEVGSEQFYKACGKRFTEVIVNTQVYDSVLSRSALMRSKDTGVKMATAFMAEPTTSLNMIQDALIQAKRNGAKGKAQARKTIGSVVASMILNSILVSFVYAGRDDDKDKTYVEKYIASLAGSLVDAFNPLSLIPYVKDIVSIVQGYDVERSDMAVISALKDAYDGLSSNSLSTYRKVEGFAGAIANIFGIPVKNIMRDARAMYNIVSGFFSDNRTTLKGIKYSVIEELTGDNASKQLKNDLYNAFDGGDTTKIKNATQELINYKVDSGKTEKEAKSSIQSTLTSYWKPLFLEAYNKNDSEEMARIRRILNATGIYKDIVETTQNWIKQSKK